MFIVRKMRDILRELNAIMEGRRSRFFPESVVAPKHVGDHGHL